MYMHDLNDLEDVKADPTIPEVIEITNLREGDEVVINDKEGRVDLLLYPNVYIEYSDEREEIDLLEFYDKWLDGEVTPS